MAVGKVGEGMSGLSKLFFRESYSLYLNDSKNLLNIIKFYPLL
jgi:hypothetical protein